MQFIPGAIMRPSGRSTTAVKFTVRKVINAPTDVVAKAMENPENAPYWQTDLERFEVVSGGPGQVGAIGRLHYNQKGRKYVLEDRMLECEPGKRYLSEVSGEALTARVETTLESENGRTRMMIKWEGSAKMLALKMLQAISKMPEEDNDTA